MVTDHLSDFLIRLKNARTASSPVVSYPYSKFINAVAEALQKEGYITISERKKKTRKFLEVALVSSAEGGHKLHDLVRVSKPSRRVYRHYKNVYPVLSGLGRTVLSTNKGVMTDRQARKEKVGGEVLFKIW